VRSATLVAWTAGPNAANLAGKSEQEIIRLALATLSEVFGRRARVSQHLIGAYLHDWQADPFACGAYSYVIAGGQGARKRLAQPIADTLFFAGEATDYEGEAATVSGALHSGNRAAQLALRAIGSAQLKHKRN
jgi:monoamine oxidase